MPDCQLESPDFPQKNHRKTVHFAPDSIVHFAPNCIVHYTPDSIVHFSPKYSISKMEQPDKFAC